MHSGKTIFLHDRSNVGDDALCVKSGYNWFGRQYGRPAKDILFRNNVIGTGHGITIGSEMSGGVENVRLQRLPSNTHLPAGVCVCLNVAGDI
eukprot:SAG31_NODE_1142_length_9696_cov_3.874232_3_plen_92_part_00